MENVCELQYSQAVLQVDKEQQEEETRKRQRTGSQFSIDELLKHDDKRSKFEADSKSSPFDEVEHEQAPPAAH